MSNAIASFTPVEFRFTSFRSLPVRHAMSVRRVGMPLEGSTGHGRDSDPSLVEENRHMFLQASGFDVADLSVALQTHTNTVAVATSADRGRGLYPAFDGFPGTDGMVTNDVSVALGVIVADCVPLVLYDRRVHALGVVHAGWRGTVGQIGRRAVAAMTQAFDSDPEDVVAGIGPSIGPCCYEVGDEVIERWKEQAVENGQRAVIRRDSSYHFDLWNANRLSLIEAGVSRQQIDISGVCVRCDMDRYFSYRAARQGKALPGRMLMVAQLLPRNDNLNYGQEST